MKTKITISGLVMVLLLSAQPEGVLASGDGFNDAVKIIEQFYHVKHRSIPLLARAGMKAVRTAAKIKGGDYKRLAEAGITDEQFSRINGPVGLNIGAKSPAEIAVSILGQIIEVRARRLEALAAPKVAAA